MKLPNYTQTIIDMRKLTHYALDPTREEGGGKAHVFEVALDITQEDADFLRDAIIQGIQTNDAEMTQKTQYGQKYEVEFEIEGLNEQVATIMTVWIVLDGEDFPRLVTTYVR